ncbi:MAG: ABC-2 family transporter protein [Candidatus Dojkabacteria bacterium]
MKQVVIKYSKIYLIFFKNSVAELGSHRFNLLMSAVGNIVWTFSQVVTLQFLFQRINSFDGWSINDMILLLAFGQIFAYTMFIFYFDNHVELQTKTVLGELDMYLTKPLNLKFFLSFASVSVAQFIPFFVAVLPLLIIGVRDLRAVGLLDIIFCITVFMIGVIAMFFLSLSIAGLNFFTDDASSVRDIVMNSMDLNRIPISILPSPAQFVFIFAIPIAFVTYYPVLILKSSQNMFLIILAGLIVLISFYLLSKIIWNQGLKRYSGAG